MRLGLALPKWLVDKDNNILVLFVYALAFGIGLPFMVVSLKRCVSLWLITKEALLYF